jgi:hypothetical protein
VSAVALGALVVAAACMTPPEIAAGVGEPCVATEVRGAAAGPTTFTWRDRHARLVRLERDESSDGHIDARLLILRNRCGDALYELEDQGADGTIDRATGYLWRSGALVERRRMSWLPGRRLQSRLWRWRDGGAIIEELDEDGDGVAEVRRELMSTPTGQRWVTFASGGRFERVRTWRGRIIVEEDRGPEGVRIVRFRFAASGLRAVEVDHEADGVLDAREEIDRDRRGRIVARRFFDRAERLPRAEVVTEYGATGLAMETWRERRDGRLVVDRVVRYRGACPAIEADRLVEAEGP